MTDRINALTVVLQSDLRDDEEVLHELVAAIRLLRGVVSVEMNVTNMTEAVGVSRARHDLGVRVLDAVQRTVFGEASIPERLK